MSAGSYIIRKARPDEYSVLLTFLFEHYIPYVEPVARYLRENEHRMDEKEKIIFAEDRRKRYNNALHERLCFVAVQDESKNIVGMSLLSVEKNPEFQETTNNHEDSADLQNPVPARSKIQIDYTRYVVLPLGQSVDFFAKFPNLHAALKLDVLCVNSSYGGQGFATRLIHEAVKYAESENIGLVYGLFTSPFSQKAAERNGFQTFSEVDILSLLDGDGNVIFKETGSYIVSVMGKYLHPSSS